MIATAKRKIRTSVFAPRAPSWVGFALVVNGQTVANLATGCPQAEVLYRCAWRVSPVCANYSQAKRWAEDHLPKRIRKQLTHR
jgi:hypothetical protein